MKVINHYSNMIHTVERCKANDKNGSRCKRRQSKGYYCWQHAAKELGVRVKKSTIPGAGWGLIDENKTFHPNQKIVGYEGKEMTSAQYEAYPNHNYGLEVTPNRVIVPEHTTDSFGAYANTFRQRDRAQGRYRNNAKLTYSARYGASLRAKHNIYPGQEILTGYGRAYRLG